jgi:hypothetical protein
MTTHTDPPVAEPRVTQTIAELIAGATSRTEVRTVDAKSGARFEKLRSTGTPTSSRSCPPPTTGSCGSRATPPTGSCSAGRQACTRRVPTRSTTRSSGWPWRAAGRRLDSAILMTDRTADLVPPGDEAVPLRHHEDFLDRKAAMHARFLGWSDDMGLCDPAHRFCFFAPEVIADELARQDVPGPIAVAERGCGCCRTGRPASTPWSRRYTPIPPRARRRPARHPADLRRGRLGAGQPRPLTGRPDRPTGLGLCRRGGTVPATPPIFTPRRGRSRARAAARTGTGGRAR